MGKSPTWTLTYVVTSPLTYEVKPLRGEKSYVDVDPRGHFSIDLLSGRGLLGPKWTIGCLPQFLHSSPVIVLSLRYCGDMRLFCCLLYKYVYIYIIYIYLFMYQKFILISLI